MLFLRRFRAICFQLSIKCHSTQYKSSLLYLNLFYKDGNDLSGPIPTEIRSLTSMTYLSLSKSPVPGHTVSEESAVLFCHDFSSASLAQ